jgi:hypothetical protein
MIKFIAILLLISSGMKCYSQNISAFSDANGKLYQFNNGQIKMIEYQTVKNLIIANNYIAYTDSRGDYWVNWQDNKIRISQGSTQLLETNNLLVAHYTSILKVVDNGKIKNLTSYVQSYGYGDSLVVYQDNIGGNLKYYYQDSIVEFAQIIGNYVFSNQQVGSNVFAYGDNAGNYFAFQQHKFYSLFSSNTRPKFSSGLNVIAYNDLDNNSFTVFRKGKIIDLENQFALAYKSGYDFVYYRDQSETHKVYYKDEVMELGYDLDDISIHDSIVTFKEAGYFKIWYDNEIYTIYNTNVTSPKIDGGIVAFKNNNGGVNAFVRGEEVEITNQRVTGFWLNGNTIVLQFSPSSYSVWWNGKMFRF